MTHKELAAVSLIFILNFAVPKRFVDFLFRKFESSLTERESIVVIVFGDVLKYANRYGTFCSRYRLVSGGTRICD